MEKRTMWIARVPQPDGTTRKIELMYFKPGATKEEVLRRWTVTCPIKFFRGVDPSKIVLEGPFEPTAQNLADQAVAFRQVPASQPKPKDKE